ncbi:MAG: SRPBCC family protein [Promethearchaeota archaeon]
MAEIYTEMLIDATPEKIWTVLMDFESYPLWNPFIKEIKGEKNLGNTLEVHFDGGMVAKPKITSLTANKRFSWLGRLFLPRLFDAEHIFELEIISETQVRFIQREVFRGLLVPFLSTLLKSTRLKFKDMNLALKECVSN